MNNVQSCAFGLPQKRSVFGSVQRAAAAWFVHACSFVIWALLSSRAVQVILYVDEGFNIALSGVHAVHLCFLTTAVLFALTITGLLTIALYKILQKKGPIYWYEDEGDKIYSATSELFISPEAASRQCRNRTLCTTSEVVYVGFMLWVCACVLWYARWMGGASTVAEAAEVVLFRINEGTIAQFDPLVASDRASGTRRLSRDDSSDVYGSCPATCLDLRELSLLQATSCICDQKDLLELYDSAANLYNQLLAALTSLLIMYGSAGVTLIYTSALLGRSDGRSELEMALEEGDRDRRMYGSGVRCSAGEAATENLTVCVR
ncbi:hypothetical protein Vafri_4229 [Volvox africanus]|uniref:Uncharacterized protein n=1 Tax=Volvox africanus TaxID=51714 RepID=A0A8J4ATP4_9CHLO|nr:hypothetical protein Vafri_4229 [Volvox africanus]